jgi:hypothetical protein
MPARARLIRPKFADNLYNRGVYNSMLIAEGIRRAQEITGKTVIDADGHAQRP